MLILAQMPYGDALAVDRFLQGAAVDLELPFTRLSSWKWGTEEFRAQMRTLRDENLRRGAGAIRASRSLDVAASAQASVVFEKVTP